jgi:acyl-CoA hydrolase
MTESSGSSQPSEPDAADADRHRLSMTILMTPDMSNFAGNVHGGILLKYLDQVAYTCATRYARTYAVTLSVDQVVFREPIHVGELVTFDASVNRTGRTSMEVGVRVTTQDLVHQTVRHTNSCYFTMVAIGPDGRPVGAADSRGTAPVSGRRATQSATAGRRSGDDGHQADCARRRGDEPELTCPTASGEPKTAGWSVTPQQGWR